SRRPSPRYRFLVQRLCRAATETDRSTHRPCGAETRDVRRRLLAIRAPRSRHPADRLVEDGALRPPGVLHCSATRSEAWRFPAGATRVARDFELFTPLFPREQHPDSVSSGAERSSFRPRRQDPRRRSAWTFLRVLEHRRLRLRLEDRPTLQVDPVLFGRQRGARLRGLLR